jgi:uncharacterized protein with PIN domain
MDTEGTPTEIRFIADTMLGKLAKWLRLLGCDVLYYPKISDGDLAEMASRSGRVILTRDTLLIRRRKVRENHFFVLGDGYKDQLRQVVQRYSIDPSARILTRCLRCNEPLTGIDRGAVRERVPPYVHETQSLFVTCTLCGRIYWRATHCGEMMKQLRAILGE